MGEHSAHRLGLPRTREDAEDGAPTSASLLRRIRVGDVSAFKELYLREYRRLWEFTYGIVHSEATADDVLQDVFADIWQRRAELVVRKTVASYLYGAVRHRALNLLRHDRLAQRVSGAQDPEGVGVPGLAVASPQPDKAVQIGDLEAALERVILALPPAPQQAILLHWRHGLSNAEVADAMGISIGAVAVHLSRARAALRPIVESWLE